MDGRDLGARFNWAYAWLVGWDEIHKIVTWSCRSVSLPISDVLLGLQPFRRAQSMIVASSRRPKGWWHVAVKNEVSRQRGHPSSPCSQQGSNSPSAVPPNDMRTTRLRGTETVVSRSVSRIIDRIVHVCTAAGGATRVRDLSTASGAA